MRRRIRWLLVVAVLALGAGGAVAVAQSGGGGYGAPPPETNDSVVPTTANLAGIPTTSPASPPITSGHDFAVCPNGARVPAGGCPPQ